MDKKHLFFVAALAAALLSNRNLAVAQDSASQPTRQDAAPKGSLTAAISRRLLTKTFNY